MAIQVLLYLVCQLYREFHLDIENEKRKYTSFCSNTSISERAMVAGLGGLNLFGVIILGAILKYV